MQMTPLMNIEEVAKLLKVSRRTMESLISKRRAPPHLLVGTQRRWRRADVQDWIAACELQGQSNDLLGATDEGLPSAPASSTTDPQGPDA